jgi:hypothetical protein
MSALDFARVPRHTYSECYVCGGPHYLNDCPDVLEADARMEAMEADYQEEYPEPVELD